MTKLRNLTFIFIVALGLAACGGQTEKTTPSGLKYTVLREGEGEVPGDSTFLLLNMVYKDNNDSVWVDTQDRGVPMVMPKRDSLWRNNEGGLEEAFIELKKGDSISVDMNVVDLFEKTFRAPLPPEIDSSTVITFYIGVDDILGQEEFMQWRTDMMQKQQQKQVEEAGNQLEEDINTIDQYLEENGIEAQETESGLRYVITEEGTGAQPVAGDSVKVNYSGQLLDGTYFDTSFEALAREHDLYDENRPGGYVPLEFQLGRRRVIQGWDEGISLMKEGGKAKFYIPSGLAYGPRDRSEVIKANSILMFDVELVEVKKANE